MKRTMSRRSLLVGGAVAAGAAAAPFVFDHSDPARALTGRARWRGLAPGVIGAATDPMSEAGIEGFEASVGATMACRRTYDYHSGSFPSTFAGSAAASDAGKRISVWSATPDMAALASGRLDSEVGRFLESIPAGHTSYLTVFHEFDDKIHKGMYTLDDWRPAFKRFCHLVHSAGRRELRTYLCPTTSWWDWGIHPSPSEYWPGDDLNGYVDVLGADSYNNYAPGKKWRTPSTMLSPVISMASTKGIPWAVSEIGCEEDPADSTRKAGWIAQLANIVDANCAYISYFNLPGTTGTRSRLIASSRAATAAFKSAAGAQNKGWRGRT